MSSVTCSGSASFLDELIPLVQAALQNLNANRQDRRPALEAERRQVEDTICGLTLSLSKPDLLGSVRAEIEGAFGTAIERREQIAIEQTVEETRLRAAQLAITKDDIIERLGRLEDVVGNADPTRTNLELSLHIDRITCFHDGRVQMRHCKLGAMPMVQDLLSGDGGDPVQAQGGNARRRTRLRIIDDEVDEETTESLVDFATDLDRFAGLGDEWFWIEDLTVPARSLSWPEANAERVFLRRQQSRLPYSALALEFEVSPPTIGAAIRYYLATHPGARDEVVLPRGGKRRPKFNLAAFADECRALYEAGWPKEKLADKYGCSPPTIAKALDLAYKRTGSRLPTLAERRASAAAEARRHFEERPSLQYIADQMKVSDCTARKYLAASFRAEGARMPDLRTLRRQARG